MGQREMWSCLSLPGEGSLLVTVLTFAQASWCTELIHPCWFAYPCRSPYVRTKGFMDHTVFFLLQGWGMS